MKRAFWVLLVTIILSGLVVSGCATPAPTAEPAPPPSPEPSPEPSPAPSPPPPATVIYVDTDSTAGPWNGTSWATAYRTVQEGLDNAVGGGEVWVAEGTYHPTDTTDREISFELKPEVALCGGFTGTETSRDQRDWGKNVTVLSGDIGIPGDDSDNSYHVVMGADDAIIDGFTISDGNGMGAVGGLPEAPGAGPPPPGAPPPPGTPPPGEGELPPIHISPEIVLQGVSPGHGAGIVNYQASPTVINCIITNNRAGKGGGAYNMTSTQRPGPPPGGPGEPPPPGAPGMGPPPEGAGAPPAGETPAPTFINCTFSDNHARGRGGGVANDLGTHSTFIGCSFINNVCDDKGGGMYNDFGCSPTLTNCLFAGNSAFMAGAMGNDGRSGPLITNSTFYGNHAGDQGAALYQGSGPANNPTVINCILWGNTTPSGAKEIFNWHECNPTVTYSCVEGGYRGTGNIDADPMFVDAGNGDFRLAAGSPCIDFGYGTAALETDIVGNPRYDDQGRADGAESALAGLPVDMGAYERQENTEISAPPTVPNPTPPPTPVLYTTEAPEPGSVPAADAIYVDADNTAGPRDGKSWSTAFNSLQEGIDYSYAADAEVWVARGTYKPTGSADRSVSFLLRNGVAVYGGFSGTETSRNQRDWEKNVTVLSGDIGTPGDNSDNSYHVLVGADDAVLDGFTVSGGKADGETYYGKGGGIVNYVSQPARGPFGPAIGLSPTIANCIFTGNSAIDGGAMYSYDRCTPTVTGCTFTDNSAKNGGAIYDNVGSNTNMTDCVFRNNYAEWRGGALVADYGSRPQITGCSFIDNSTDGSGGAMFTISRASQLDRTIPEITGCTFSGNTAGLLGGAIFNFDKCLVTIADSTFTDNHAAAGGAIANAHQTILSIADCTFDGNTADEGEADIDTDDTSTVEIS